jgi:hypothetical protein
MRKNFALFRFYSIGFFSLKGEKYTKFLHEIRVFVTNCPNKKPKNVILNVRP